MGVRPGRPARQPVVTLIKAWTVGGNVFSGETEADWQSLGWGEDAPDEREIWLEIVEENRTHYVRLSAVVAVTEW
jgi:hypothetical protein